MCLIVYSGIVSKIIVKVNIIQTREIVFAYIVIFIIFVAVRLKFRSYCSSYIQRVIPAKAGIQWHEYECIVTSEFCSSRRLTFWMPAFAGMTFFSLVNLCEIIPSPSWGRTREGVKSYYFK